MKKKKLLCLSTVGAVLFGVFLTISLMGVCFLDYICDRTHDDSMAAIFFPLFPLFIFSLITYKMREEVLEIWWKFARIWIPVSMLAILIAPSYTHNWILPIVKGTVAFASVVLFVIISLALIIWQSNKERKK